jgi:ribose transport system substrate-binding protein
MYDTLDSRARSGNSMSKTMKRRAIVCCKQWLSVVTRLGLVLLVLSIAGCGKSNSDNQNGGDGNADKPEIALIMKSLANEFFKTMAEGAEQHQQANSDDYTLIVNGIKDERDLAQQVALVEQMVARGVDAIVIAPADSQALVTACRRAQQEGIVVVNIDNKLDAEVLKQENVQIPFVGPDNRAGARAVGDALAKELTAGDEVAIIEGVRSAFNGQQRRLGFEDAMTAADIKVIDSQSGEWEMDRANKVAAAMLSEHPSLKALLCCNDNMALGALSAVKAAGRNGEVMVVGFDNISDIREKVKDGSVLATADQHGDQLAVYGIEYALQILRDESIPEDKETPVDLITAETLR